MTRSETISPARPEFIRDTLDASNIGEIIRPLSPWERIPSRVLLLLKRIRHVGGQLGEIILQQFNSCIINRLLNLLNKIVFFFYAKHNE